MGDHKIITAYLGDLKPKPKITKRRSWKNYSKVVLLEQLNEVKFDLEMPLGLGLDRDGLSSGSDLNINNMQRTKIKCNDNLFQFTKCRQIYCRYPSIKPGLKGNQSCYTSSYA